MNNEIIFQEEREYPSGFILGIGEFSRPFIEAADKKNLPALETFVITESKNIDNIPENTFPSVLIIYADESDPLAIDVLPKVITFFKKRGSFVILGTISNELGKASLKDLHSQANVVFNLPRSRTNELFYLYKLIEIIQTEALISVSLSDLLDFVFVNLKNNKEAKLFFASDTSENSCDNLIAALPEYIKGANNYYVGIGGDEFLELEQVSKVMDAIYEMVPENANLIFGALYLERVEGNGKGIMELFVVACNFP